MFTNHLIHFTLINKWFIADTKELWTLITIVAPTGQDTPKEVGRNLVGTFKVIILLIYEIYQTIKVKLN
jgi:hypothetical protein